MSRELVIVRHAKSDWADGGLSDHDRPLNDRGRRDAPRMAAALAGQGLAPGAILSSTALRAFTTARVFAAGLGFPEEKIVTDRRWYLAEPAVWMETIRSLNESLGTVLIFGHNPGLEELANLLPAPPAGVGALTTCAVVRLRLPGNATWAEAGPGRFEFVEHLHPKGL